MEKPIEMKIRVSKPVTRDLYAAATFIWSTGRKVTRENLMALVKTQKIEADERSIDDMVKISDFLDMVCP